MQDKIEKKKIKVSTILLAILFFVVTFLVIVGVLLYGFGMNNRFMQKTMTVIPYPIAFWGRDVITVGQLKKQLSAVQMFYENQDFSDIGMRVDFTTEDGKKRLKIKEKNILNRLIENRLIENELELRGLKMGSEDIAQEVSRKIKEYQAEEQLRENLMRLYGWTIDDFRENIVKPDMYRDKLAEDVMKNDQSRIHAREKINLAFEELKSKKDFISVVKKYSEGESVKSDGELGWFAKSEMLPEIVDGVFALKKGEMSSVIESSLGYHIVLMVDKKTENDVEQVYLKQVFVRAISFSDWLDKYIKDFNVHVFSHDFYWNKSKGLIQFRDENLTKFEENLEENSAGDISVLF